jgi:hypothetical protein
MSRPSLGVVDIPAQWDARNAKRCFGVRVRNHQQGSGWCEDCSWGNGRRLSGCTVLTTMCLQKDFFLIGEEDGTICGIVGIEVLSQMWWGRLCVLLGVYHTLVWNGIMQYRLGGVVARTVVGPDEGQAVLEDVVDCLSLSVV